MLALASGCEEPSPTLAPRSLFRSDSAEGSRGEKLLHDAIREVECLKEIFTGAGRDQNNLAEAESCPSPGTSNGDTGSFNGSLEFCRAESDAGQREINQRLVNLYGLLHGLQAVVSQQDTLLELQLQEGPEKPPSRRGSAAAPAEPAARAAGEKPGATELALLQRQHGLLQEELGRCRQLCQERAQEAAALETRLRGQRAGARAPGARAGGGPAALGRPAARWRPEGTARGSATEESAGRGRALPQLHPAPAEPRPPPRQPELPPPRLRPLPPPGAGLPGGGADPDRLREEGDDALDALLEDEALGSRHSPPASPRDFLRMQDIPEEVESSQELKEGDGGSSDS
ncbi:unnamed protein product [Bubo scandiacus]